MKLNIAILEGDGIGPEIMKQGVAVLDAVAQKCGHEFNYETAICGAHAIDAVGDPYPDATHDVCMRADAVLFAAVGDLKYDHDPTAKIRPETGLLAMRKKLGLFANVRPVATFDCLLHKSPLKEELLRGADFVVIRELTGGMYFGEKHQDNEMAYDTNIYTRPEIERILKVAFEMAMTRRKHLTVVDKANVLASSRLWRQVAKEMDAYSDDQIVLEILNEPHGMKANYVDELMLGAYEVIRKNAPGKTIMFEGNGYAKFAQISNVKLPADVGYFCRRQPVQVLRGCGHLQLPGYQWRAHPYEHGRIRRLGQIRQLRWQRAFRRRPSKMDRRRDQGRRIVRHVVAVLGPCGRGRIRGLQQGIQPVVH